MKTEQDHKTVIQLRNKSLVLEIKDFSNEVNVEELLQVDINNILGDIITFPVIHNRLAVLRAEMENILNEYKFDYKTFEAELWEECKKAIVKEGVDKPTEKNIENAVQRSPKYKAKTFELYKYQKQMAILDGLYWASKSKDEKLNKISEKLTPEDFEKEILEGTINSVQIKSVKNNFRRRE
jgi:hypothetical protein